MAMKLLVRFISGLTVSFGFVAILLTVLNATIFSASYIQSKIDQSQMYDKLRSAITDQIAESSGMSETELNAKKQTLEQILGGDALKDKLDATLSDIEAYYKDGGDVPTISFDDLVADARARGIEVPADFNAPKPITLDALKTANPVADLYRVVAQWSILAAVVLYFILVCLCAFTRNFKPLATVILVIGASLLPIALVFLIIPNAVQALFFDSLQNTGLASIISEIGRSIAQDVGIRLAMISLGMLAVGIIARIIIGKLQASATPKAPNAPPNQSHTNTPGQLPRA